MHLRTVESYWLLQNGLMYSYPSLQQDMDCEIALIGGGITGALISHALLNAGYEVTLFDRRDIGQGSSSATTSMLQYEIDTQLLELSAMIGEDNAARAYHAGIEAIYTLEQLVQEQGIDCDFERKQSLYLPHSKRAVNGLREEYEIRQKHGLGVEWLDSTQIEQTFGMKAEAGILSSVAASIDAYRFAHELLHKNTSRNLQIFDQTDTAKFQTTAEGMEFKANGHAVRAKQVVFCSGFESLSLFKKDYAQVVSTFATVSEQNIEMPSALQHTMFWDTGNPYIYGRTTADKRLLIGGEDVKWNGGGYRESMKARKAAKLIKKLERLIPSLNFIEDFHWAGAFGITKDGLPFIGRQRDYPNAVFVLGFGGNGITFSVQAMELVLHALNGRSHLLLDMYRFDR